MGGYTVMVSERSKITPDTFQEAYNDPTFLVEGREAMLEKVRSTYPTETETEQDKISRQIFDPNSELNKTAVSTADAFGGELPDLNIEGAEQIEPFEGAEELFSEQPEPEPFQPPSGQTFTEKERIQFSTDFSLDPREPELARKIKSHNLDETLEAFQEINADPDLTARFDTNNDGVFSFKDMFNTTGWNNGQGMTEEEDREMTAKWVNDITKKNFAARLGSIANNLPLLANKTAFIMNGRQGRLAETKEGLARLNPWANTNNFDDNLNAGMLESTIGTLNLVEQGTHFITGGRFGTAEGNRLGDRIFNTSNADSIASMMLNPAKRSFSDGLAHEIGFWGLEGVQIWLTAGIASGATTGKALMNLPKGKRAAMMVNKLISMNPGTKTAVKTWSKEGIKTTFKARTHLNIFSKKIALNPKIAKTYNLAGSLTKAGLIESSKGAFTRDLTYAAEQGLYDGNGIPKQLATFLGSNIPIIGPQLMWAVNSPVGNRVFYWFDESMQEAAFGGIMFGGYNKLIAPGFKFGARVTEPLRTSLFGRFWNGHPINQISSKDLVNAEFSSKQNAVEAAKVQQTKNIDPENPYNDEITNQGGFKNKDSNNDVGQGKSNQVESPRKIAHNQDEIDANLATSTRGSTGSALSPVELRTAAKYGPNGPIYKKLTKELVEDPKLPQELNTLDPAARTVGDYGQGTLQRLKKIVEGRNAENFTPEEYWPKELLDQPIAAGSLEELTEQQAYMAEKIFVADALNSSLLNQLRDISGVMGEQSGKQDIWAVDGGMQKVTDNLIAGLSNVKQTRLRWSLLGERLKAADGNLNPKMIEEVEALVKARNIELHGETVDGVRLMMELLKKSDDADLTDGLLDVFKVSNDIHNWTDFDAWMRQKIVGGEFKGKVKTGALIRELQGVMVNSILSGPKTPLRAIIGTTTNAYLNAFNEYAGALLRSPFNKDVASVKASGAKLKAMLELVPEGWTVFKENWHSNFKADFATIRTRYSEPPTTGDNNWHLFGKYTEIRGTDGEKAAFYLANQARTLNNNKLASWSPRALSATDDTFRWLLARARSKEVGMRAALDAAGDDWVKLDANILKKAEENHYSNLLDQNGDLNLKQDSWLNKQFKEITLTSELGGFSKKLDSLLGDTPLLKPFYLFARTGINGINLSVKNTPLLGALHKESIDILRHTGDDFRPLYKYGIENANDLANAKNLFAGRQAVGATVVTGISGMYIAGQLTGNGPADRQLKQSWMNAGWKPNHIYIGNVGFNYTSLEPFNMIFSAIADVGDNLELMGSEWAEKRLQAVAFVLGRGLTSKTYMSGLDQLMQVIQMKPGALTKSGANILNNSIPLAGMRNELGKWVNPYMKELNSDIWSSLRNRNQLSELAVKEKLPIKYDILNGNPINNWNIFGRSFNMISPIQMDIRSDSPGRQLLQQSNYDLKTTTYAYGGYSFAKDAQVRSAFQSEIGKAPITFRNKTFPNLEKALDYISTLPDVKTSLKEMQGNTHNPAKMDINPNDYPHNTIIDNLVEQARSKAWAAINQPNHEAYPFLQRLKSEKDGLNTRTRDARKEILEINYPSKKQTTMFPK